MSNVPATIEKTLQAEAIERVVIQGDLSKMSADERVKYYRLVCESVGLNPLTKPFEYITLNGKLTLYARKDATDQLRSIHQVSVRILHREIAEGCYVVTAQASFPSGRVDESIGAVAIDKLSGEVRANAMMKAETKAKRRVTLSACGLGMLDETEIETIPSARTPDVPRTDKPIPIPRNPVIETAEASGLEPEKIADQPQEGQARAAVPPRRTDDEVKPLADALEKVINPQAEETIDLPRQRAIHREFKETLTHPLLVKKAEQFLRDWLQSQGYMDADRKGTTKTIPMVLFDEVKSNAIQYASAIDYAEHNKGK